MAKYREILTKAIIGKGTNKIEENQVIEVDEEISRALGCWIINHQSSIKVEDEKIFAFYDKNFVNHDVWYGFNHDKNCKLANKVFEFTDEISYKFNDNLVQEINEQTEIKKYVNKQPTCVELKYEKNKIFVKVNRIYSIDIVGETKLTISVNEEEKKDDISNINPNYISDKKNS